MDAYEDTLGDNYAIVDVNYYTVNDNYIGIVDNYD